MPSYQQRSRRYRISFFLTSPAGFYIILKIVTQKIVGIKSFLS
nr:MAG TPA: hypothetical protein [Caudoviricetes sp.]